ncbi:MAG TPA: hypothetical protein VLK65_27505 [Vicinamibacteria bacterium]|nr:hypothetical protein [Vicinamibacteria bacterium]
MEVIKFRKPISGGEIMQHSRRWLIAVLVLVVVPFIGCGSHGAEHQAEHPAEVEHIEGSDLSRVTLTEKAIERLALETSEVREASVTRSDVPRRVVPYSSLIYDPQGNTWVYTSPQPRTFVREQVEVDYIEGDLAVLNDGPPTGTVVASVGVAELYGTEFQVGH